MREETTAHGQLDQAQPQPSLAAPAWVYGKAAGAHRAGATLEPDAAQAKESLLKRPFDLFVAAVGLLIASPLWLVFSVAIKLEDRGPILFVQDRGERTRPAYGCTSFVPWSPTPSRSSATSKPRNTTPG